MNDDAKYELTEATALAAILADDAGRNDSTVRHLGAADLLGAVVEAAKAAGLDSEMQTNPLMASVFDGKTLAVVGWLSPRVIVRSNQTLNYFNAPLFFSSATKRWEGRDIDKDAARVDGRRPYRSAVAVVMELAIRVLKGEQGDQKVP